MGIGAPGNQHLHRPPVVRVECLDDVSPDRRGDDHLETGIRFRGRARCHERKQESGGEDAWKETGHNGNDSHYTAPMTDLDTQVAARLEESGARLTTTRRRVVHALVEAPGPLAAAELATSLGTVPLSSLYRSLSVLGDARVVQLHHGPDGVTRWEPAEWLSGHHHHLVCVDCGAVADFELDERAEAILHDLADDVAHANGYAASGHALEIEGRCKDCASA